MGGELLAASPETGQINSMRMKKLVCGRSSTRQETGQFLDTGRQRTRPVLFDAEDICRSAVLPGFWLRKSWLLKQETDVFTAFTEIIGQQVLDDLRAK